VSGAKRMLTVRSCKLALIQTSEDCRSHRFRLIGTSDRDRARPASLTGKSFPPTNRASPMKIISFNEMRRRSRSFPIP
jgi:hypothetical protein